MTFLNGILAFGAAAFTIPLIIHLLNRSRYRTIQWGAMHLLDSVIRVNSKRIQIEQLILLLVRCAIPILLAFCLARPVLTLWRALPGDAPNATVILLDNSYSMDAKSGDQSPWTEAVGDACDVIDALPRGSEVSVVTIGGGPKDVLDSPIFDPKTMRQQVRLLHGGFGASKPIESLESGLATLSRSSHARRDLILISDFQNSDWESIPAATFQRIRQQMDALPISPAFTLIRRGGQVKENVSIDSLSFSTKALGVGQDLRFRANLRNHGPRGYPGVRVVLRVDGKRQTASRIPLPAGATAQALFTHQFKTAGSHVVEVEAVVDDQLEIDNRYAAAISVLDKIEVLLVDGAPGSQPLESETDFLAVALTPFAFGRDKLSDLIETQTIPVSKMTRETVVDARVVVLANVPALSASQVELLTSYVRGGGSLLVFAGNKIDIDWYNRTLASAGGGLLPLPFDLLQGGEQQQIRSTRIVAQHFEHPALQIFNDRANGNLADAEIRHWYRLGGTGDADLADQEVVIARLETGDPLIVERQFGAGLVVQVATACDADWSNLPMRPAYLPLMQQLVTTMATRVTPPCNILTGDVLVAMWPDDGSRVPLTLTTPSGTRHTVRPSKRGTRNVVQFSATHQPGTYTLTESDGHPRHFVVETSRSESDLRLLDEARLESIAEALSANLVRSGAEYLALDATRRNGREIWRLLLALVLGLMFVELFLQQRFARVRT